MNLDGYGLLFMLHTIMNGMIMVMFKSMFYVFTKIKCNGLWDHGLNEWLYWLWNMDRNNETIRIHGVYGCYPSPDSSALHT